MSCIHYTLQSLLLSAVIGDLKYCILKFYYFGNKITKKVHLGYSVEPSYTEDISSLSQLYMYYLPL